MASTYVLWYYTPSLYGAAIVAAIFGILTITHLILRVRRGLKYTNCLIAGGIFECVGYCFRAYAHFNKTSITPYAIQSLLILLGPILFAASVYQFLSRVIRASGAETLSPLPVGRIAKIFVLGDISCFLIQAVGGGVLSAAKTDSLLNIGNDIILAGLIIQIIIFAGFVATISIFHHRFNQVSEKITTPLRFPIMLLYSASALITLRNVYRVLEYAMGQSGYLVEHEWNLYVFDAAPMLCVIIATVAIHHFNLHN